MQENCYKIILAEGARAEAGREVDRFKIIFRVRVQRSFLNGKDSRDTEKDE